MNIIEKIKAEIEGRLKFHNDVIKNSAGLNVISLTHSGGLKEDEHILSILSSLESEKPMNQDEELYDKKWISSKVAKPEKTGLYLITDGSHWNILLVNKGEVMIYEDWDDGYTTDKDYLNIEWWWRPLPNLPNGKTPYYYE